MGGGRVSAPRHVPCWRSASSWLRCASTIAAHVGGDGLESRVARAAATTTDRGLWCTTIARRTLIGMTPLVQTRAPRPVCRQAAARQRVCGVKSPRYLASLASFHDDAARRSASCLLGLAGCRQAASERSTAAPLLHTSKCAAGESREIVLRFDERNRPVQVLRSSTHSRAALRLCQNFAVVARRCVQPVLIVCRQARTPPIAFVHRGAVPPRARLAAFRRLPRVPPSASPRSRYIIATA